MRVGREVSLAFLFLFVFRWFSLVRSGTRCRPVLLIWPPPFGWATLGSLLPSLAVQPQLLIMLSDCLAARVFSCSCIAPRASVICEEEGRGGVPRAWRRAAVCVRFFPMQLHIYASVACNASDISFCYRVSVLCAFMGFLFHEQVGWFVRLGECAEVGLQTDLLCVHYIRQEHPLWAEEKQEQG